MRCACAFTPIPYAHALRFCCWFFPSHIHAHNKNHHHHQYARPTIIRGDLDITKENLFGANTEIPKRYTHTHTRAPTNFSQALFFGDAWIHTRTRHQLCPSPCVCAFFLVRCFGVRRCHNLYSRVHRIRIEGLCIDMRKARANVCQNKKDVTLLHSQSSSNQKRKKTSARNYRNLCASCLFLVEVACIACFPLLNDSTIKTERNERFAKPKCKKFFFAFFKRTNIP